MFLDVLGKKETDIDDQDIILRISKMNLTDMRAYINNQIGNLEVNEDGLNEVVFRLITPNKTTSKRYIETDDMDIKKKKGFDLILNILSNKEITIVTLESVNKFLGLYKDIIDEYDKENKQIYASKLRDAMEIALKEINVKTELSHKMEFIG